MYQQYILSYEAREHAARRQREAQAERYAQQARGAREKRRRGLLREALQHLRPAGQPQ